MIPNEEFMILIAYIARNSGRRACIIRMEQRTICEDGTFSARRGVSCCGGRHGEEPKVALEQKCEAIDRKCKGNARRNGSKFIREVPARNWPERILG